MPSTTKSGYALRDAHVNQGYTADGAEGKNDHKECYEHRRFQNDLCPDNTTLPAFKANVDKFYAHCLTLGLNVLKCLAIVMKLGDTFFDKITLRADPQLRLLHYPSIKRSEIERPGHGRINAHTDFGLCTLLFQDSIGGLEIDAFHTGKYSSAPPIPGTCLVNIGDLMTRLTNGRAKSTLHRVVSPSASKSSALNGHTNGTAAASAGDDMLPARYSIPFFIHPDPETLIDPITMEEGEEKKFKAVNAGEWRDYNTRRNYGYEGIDRMGLGRELGEEDHVQV